MKYDGRLYTQAEVDDLIRSLRSLIEASKLINLEYNGRSDCKNCALQEQLAEELDKFENTCKLCGADPMTAMCNNANCDLKT